MQTIGEVLYSDRESMKEINGVLEYVDNQISICDDILKSICTPLWNNKFFKELQIIMKTIMGLKEVKTNLNAIEI